MDESRKEHVSKEKGKPSKAEEPGSISFSTFITSLGIQAFLKMGELRPPEGEHIEVDIEAAQETIDLLLLLREKTKGNLTEEENTLLNSLVADLQVKFLQHKTS